MATQEPDECNLVLNQTLDLRFAQHLQDKLLAVLADGRPVRIDAAVVARMSTAAVQLFLAFLSAAREHGTEVRFASMSPAFASAFDMLGFAGVLGRNQPEVPA